MNYDRFELRQDVVEVILQIEYRFHLSVFVCRFSAIFLLKIMVPNFTLRMEMRMVLGKHIDPLLYIGIAGVEGERPLISDVFI